MFILGRTWFVSSIIRALGMKRGELMGGIDIQPTKARSPNYCTNLLPSRRGIDLPSDAG